MRKRTLVDVSPDISQFPSVAHFWPCYQSEIGNYFLYDIVNGIKLNRNSISGSGDPAIPWTYVPGPILTPVSPDGYSVFPSSPLAENNVVGNITNPYPHPFMWFTVAKYGTGNGGMALGNFAVINHTPAGDYSGVSTSGWGACPLCGDSGACIPPATGHQFDSKGLTFTLSASDIYGRAIIVNDYAAVDGAKAAESTTTVGSMVDVTTLNTNDFGVTLTSEWSALAHLSNGWGCGAPTNLYGAALFIFPNGIPTDYLTAMAYMTGQWSQNDPTTNGKPKLIYPGWVNKT